MRSCYSTVLDHSAGRVWATVRDFNGLAEWFSGAVISSKMEDGRAGDQVGSVRRFVLGGDTIREKLLAHSDLDRAYSYEFMPPPPFPVTNYVATLTVTPVTDGDRAFVAWWANFDCEVSEQDKWRKFFANEVLAPALEGLREYLKT